ncbi:MAG: lysylphosphatidylglycerol synthase domain-containing protein, partial [Pirellulaceae bacterium]|nr:lysylphosphatidylglycerol synthase domain-containing protein [Pirellulaceae bacterium]
YAAKYSHRRADTLMSIVVDRITGLLGLVVLAGVAGIFMLRVPVVALVTLVLGVSVVVLGVIAACYFTPAIRRALGFDWVLGRLPGHRFFARIDEAAVAYRHHKLAITFAIGMSVMVHACLATATGLAGYALGMQTPFGVLLNVVPILFFAAAMPLTYQGLGVMEWLATTMILNPPATMANHVLGMLLLVRIFQILFATCGSLFLLSGDIHMHPKPDSE